MDEIALLTKAVVKFPPGTRERWQTISDFIGSKSTKETIAMAKDIQERKNRAQEEKKVKEAAE